jgi:hypothetical protein
MTTTNNPAHVRPADAPNADGATTDAPRGRVTTQHGDETKAFYKTTEFVVFVAMTLGVLLASFVVGETDTRGDYFMADKAWLYVVILTVGYMISRGLAKSGTRHHRDA